MEKHHLHNELSILLTENPCIFHSIQTDLLNGLWYWDLENMENKWGNERFWFTLGYAPPDIPKESNALQNTIHPNDYQLALVSLEKHLKDPSSPFDLVMRFKHKDGGTVWIRSFGEAIYNTQGVATRLFAALRHITTNKKQLDTAMLKIKQQADELLKVQEIAHLGRWHINLATQCITWSNELYTLFGLDAELPLLPYNEQKKLIAPESWDQLETSIKQTITQGTRFELEIKIVKNDGSNGWLWVYGEAVRDTNQQVVAIWGAAQDISEQKRTKLELSSTMEAAEASEQQFRQLFANMEQGFALLKVLNNDQGQVVNFEFVLLNKASENIIGLAQSNCAGKTIYEVFPEIDPATVAKYCQIAESGNSANTQELIKKTERHYNFMAYTPRKGLFALILTDITDNKLYENSLIKARAEAEEHDRLKSAFLANMSHEIRTPMNAIIGFASFLKNRNKSRDELDQFADIIINGGNHLLNLINDIIDISKIDSGQIKVSKSVVEINELLQELYSFFYSDIEIRKSGKIKLQLTLPENSLKVFTDEVRLRQIFINLLGNAVKFTRKGSIAFGYVLKGDKIEFYIKDTGIGIPKEKQNLIFQRFQQATESTEKTYGGTGLGLSIAKACTQMLNGSIWLESTPNQGTTFFFTIDHEPAHIVPSQITVTKNGHTFNRELVLVAEDDDYNFEYLEALLTDYNLTVIRAANGREAIDKALKTKDLRLVLMDIQMPDLNGIQATKEIKKLKPELPIIAQTAYALDNDRERFLEIGCNEYLAKPIRRNQLIGLLNNLFDAKGAVQESASIHQ